MSITAPDFLKKTNTNVNISSIKEKKRDRSFVKKALILEMLEPVMPHDERFYEDTINHVISQHPNATGEMLEIVLMSRNANYVGWPCGIFVHNDSDLIFELFRQLRLDSENNDSPAAWKIKYDFDLFAEFERRQKKPKVKTRVQKSTPDKPFIVDPKTVPEHLKFMLTDAFKDQASEFYRRLDDISMSSDGAWIKKYYVDRLSDWPHIKRADDAMGGLISQVMTVVANNPRFPNWWRSYSIALRRGDPVAAIEACHDVLKSPEIKDFTNEEVVPFTVTSSSYSGSYSSSHESIYKPKLRKSKRKRYLT